jgi:hypothetical protein
MTEHASLAVVFKNLHRHPDIFLTQTGSDIAPQNGGCPRAPGLRWTVPFIAELFQSDSDMMTRIDG